MRAPVFNLAERVDYLLMGYFRYRQRAYMRENVLFQPIYGVLGR